MQRFFFFKSLYNFHEVYSIPVLTFALGDFVRGTGWVARDAHSPKRSKCVSHLRPTLSSNTLTKINIMQNYQPTNKPSNHPQKQTIKKLKIKTVHRFVSFLSRVNLKVHLDERSIVDTFMKSIATCIH